MNLKCPIDDVNALRDIYGNLQLWMAYRITIENNRQCATCDELLQFVRSNVATAPVWTVHMGTVGDDATKQVTLACRKPSRVKNAEDRIGRRIARGTIDEVWPVFEAYVRML